MTGRKVPRRDLAPLRYPRRALRHRQWAPRVKAAPARRRQRAWDFALENDPLFGAQVRRDWLGFGREQRLRVGMLRRRHDGLRRAKLDQYAEIHYRDAIAHMRNDAQV